VFRHFVDIDDLDEQAGMMRMLEYQPLGARSYRPQAGKVQQFEWGIAFVLYGGRLDRSGGRGYRITPDRQGNDAHKYQKSSCGVLMAF
jgi:hypothetical protein